MAVLVRLSCEEEERANAVVPVVIYLPALASRQLSRALALAQKGKLKEAHKALNLASAFAPGSPAVYYRKAHLAALAADEAGAVGWLKKLKALGTVRARRLVVKARWDSGFRLIKDSAAFKAATGLR